MQRFDFRQCHSKDKVKVIFKVKWQRDGRPVRWDYANTVSQKSSHLLTLCNFVKS